jgi:septum formation topological specificity factor MinE
MTTDRLQLLLLLDRQPLRQPLPPDVREESVEIIARMLLHLLRREARQGREVHCESC